MFIPIIFDDVILHTYNGYIRLTTISHDNIMC